MMIEEIKQPEETIPITQKESEEVPIKVYQEVLYSKDQTPKKPTVAPEKKKESLKRTSWESVGTIEHTVDIMEQKTTKSMGSTRKKSGSQVIEKKVDRILRKKKVKP
jgi:hypothetical protein